MSWKKLFFAGAVLVLTACNNATAPSPSALTKLDGGAVKSTTDSTSIPALTPTTGVSNDCSSQVAHIGLDGATVMICVPAPSPGMTITW